jgi:hypothetical protein
VRRLGALLGLLAIAACAGPAARFDREASSLGLAREDIAGAGFTHAVYRSARAAAGGDLHIYLEGDGTAWVSGRYVAVDPTPRMPVALLLMTRDPAPALLLGRPCYHGHYADPGCTPSLWTGARYSEAVVASMAAALESLRAPGARLTLIGHSGGGTLAMLLAERVPGVDTVVTVAGNLDVAGWTRLHDYAALSDSLDPGARGPLPTDIRQIHFAGGRDGEVPPDLVRGAVRRQPGARFEVVDSFDHRCCWEREWPELLTQITLHPVAAVMAGAHTRAPRSAQ